MGVFDGYSDFYDSNARLAILKSLHEQPDRRLSDSMLVDVLAAYAINRGRDYVRTQLNWLETQAGAVSLMRAGAVVIAELTEAGDDHVECRHVLPGIKRPAAAR